MKSKKLQIILLALVLAAVVAVGIWALTSLRDTDMSQESIKTAQPEGTEDTDSSWLVSGQVQYKSLGLKVQTGKAYPCESYERFWTYGGQLCQLNYVEADGIWQLTSMENGEILKTYDGDCFAGEVCTLSLDREGNLWAIFWDDDSGFYRLGLCEPGKTMADAATLDRLDAQTMYPQRLEQWENTVMVQYLDQMGGSNLALIDSLNQTMQAIEGVKSFCADGSGSLYCLIENEKYEIVLEKYSLKEGTLLWKQEDIPFNATSLWYLEGAGLFLLSGLQEQWTVAAVNTEVGTVDTTLLDVWSDTDIGAELARFIGYELGISSNGQICFSVTDYDLNEDNPYFERYTWCLEAFVPEVAPEDVVTLTITSPYIVESLQSSIRLYQTIHPEVEVVWDTQYLSREEYQKNALQYKEQLALRVMTGKVGDIVMICGSGLSQDVITDTDAFTDLTDYLEDCEFREELEISMLEALRGADGAVRGIPIATVPSYFVYNETLLEQLGYPIDPDAVTWSELLDLAHGWKQEGADLSLISTESGMEDSVQQSLLSYLLLANLYGAEQEDGTAEVDWSYLRELLEKLKALWDSPWLVRDSGSWITEGFFQNSLFTTAASSRSFLNRLSDLVAIESRERVHVRIAPTPWGETYKKQQAYGFCWGISSYSQEKDAAWELLEFFISSDGLPGYTYTAESIPWNDVAMEGQYEAYLASGLPSERTEVFFGQMKLLRSLPISRFDEPYGWHDAVYVPILEYMEGNTALDDALDLAAENWKRFRMG